MLWTEYGVDLLHAVGWVHSRLIGCCGLSIEWTYCMLWPEYIVDLSDVVDWVYRVDLLHAVGWVHSGLIGCCGLSMEWTYCMLLGEYIVDLSDVVDWVYRVNLLHAVNWAVGWANGGRQTIVFSVGGVGKVKLYGVPVLVLDELRVVCVHLIHDQVRHLQRKAHSRLTNCNQKVLFDKQHNLQFSA